MWDVFISHASEDKPFVRELANALESQGLQVWFDERTLKLGDSLRRSIDQGLSESRYGLIVISPAFFQKSWTQYELDGLVTLQMAHGKRILPIWHNISQGEVLAQSPPLAGLLAVSTDKGMNAVVDAIIDVVNPGQQVVKSPASNPREGSTTSNLVDRNKFLKILTNYFNMGELQDLCFELGIDFEDLAGSGKRDKARELITYLERRNQLSKLVQLVRQKRPDVAW